MSGHSGVGRPESSTNADLNNKRFRSMRDVSTRVLASPSQWSRHSGDTIANPHGGHISHGQTKVMELQNYVSNKIEMMKNNHLAIKKCTQLAAFIPDFILLEEMTRKLPYQTSRDAVVLFADVSGFTALTEAYSLKGKGGTDQLTKTLMNYIGPLAECILYCDGDIVKYAGDAFLAFWPSSPDSFPEDVQRAIDCALYIQEKYGVYLCKDVGITIKVKVGIGAGTIHLSWLGNESYQHYVCFGPGVEAASGAEKHCTSGEVILAPAAWKYCTPSHYKVTHKEDGYQMVTDITAFVNPSKRGRPLKRARRSIGWNGLDNETIRPQLARSIEIKDEDFMRKFVLPAVLKKLDDDIPLEYINESRNICICFIHVETQAMPRDGVGDREFRETMTKIVNKGFLKIYSTATKMQGALTKVIMFDKGLTYLVAFGLPGYINENQSAHALKFSDQVRHGLLGIPSVTAVSIGVTTGSCYCGVLGHPRRQEYTMIGRKVNKAARLMCYYPGKVTCDQDTAYHSKLAMSNFELQEYKELKGIANPGKIYEYTNKDTLDDNAVATYIYPILGRDSEVRYFKDVLLKVQREFSEHARANALTSSWSSGVGKETAVARGVWMIVFEGDIGVGKSRMLGACIAEAERQNVKVFSVAMNLILSGQSLFGLSSLVVDAIGISELRTIQEREDFLRKRVNDADLAADLCVLNDIIHTKFPLNPKYQALDVNATHIYGQHVLSTLLKVLYPDELIILVIDDAHLMDTISWEYIGYLARTPYVFTICSLRRNNAGSPRLPDVVTRIVYHNKNVKTVRLSGVDTQYCLPLACQLMDVNAIPQDVLKILVNKSQGVPAWCDQVLHELVRTGVLRVNDFFPTWKRQYMSIVERRFIEKNRTINKRSGKGGGGGWMQDIDAHHPHPNKLAPHDDSLLTRGSSTSMMQDLQGTGVGFDDVDPAKRMLVVKSDTNIAHIPISGTLNEILLDSYDELNSTEQIILKGASVLGRKFSRLMLTRMLTSEFDPKKAVLGINHLMESRYLRCGSRTGPPLREKGSGYTEPKCFCKPDEVIDAMLNPSGIPSSAKRPAYFDCKCMEFVKENLVEVVYNLMTEDHRKKFHLRAAKYLDDTLDMRCESCGGGSSLYAFGITIKSADLGLIDDDLLRAAAVSTKKKSIGIKLIGEGDEAVAKKNRKTSAVTQLQGLKKVLASNGTKVGQIEVDILRTLRHIEIEGRPKWICCKDKNAEELQKEADELDKELNDLRDEGEANMANLKSSSDDKDMEDSKPSPYDSLSRPIDLRTCECNPLQAKFCIEMVKHYREAQKYGKCLVNLLEAAESVISTGNGTQALIHLEDSIGLMKAIKKGDFPAPLPDDVDDSTIDFDDADGQVEYLSGLAYFEIGVNTKARDFFIKSLARLGLNLGGTDEGKFNSASALFSAKMALWRSHHLTCCCTGRRYKSSKTKADLIGNEVWAKEVRILSYLHILFKQEKKYEMALLATIWAVMIAEQFGEVITDIIPAYCHMMEMYSALAQHDKAIRYEKRALKLIRSSFGSNEQIDAMGLITTANLFLEVALTRLSRGSIATASEAGYLTLQITQMLHENNMLVRIMPTLIQSLLLSLRITEAIEALQKLWYTAEEEDDWLGVAMYYTLCLELLLNTAYPMENFVTCESFVTNSDWKCESNMYRDYEIQYNMESSLALWYARYSRWDLATKWSNEAESHKPKLISYVTVAAECKLLECLLIIVEHYLDSKRYQHFAKARNQAKLVMRSLAKSTKIVPMWEPRFLHLMAYYYRIRSRNVDAEKQMKAAEKLAVKHGNKLEQEWIIHNRTVWNELAIPTVKYFWLEHTETHTLDWHSSGKIPWANIMYSLPLPEWKG